VTTNESWRRYLEAGAAVGQLTLARAEEIARGLLAPGEEERSTAWAEFEELTRFGRLMGEQLVEAARSGVTKQLEMFGVGSLDQLWERISDLVGSAGVDESYQSTPNRAAEVPEDLIYRPAGAEVTSTHPGQAAGTGDVGHPKDKKDKDGRGKKDKKDKDGRGKKGPKGKRSKKHKEENEEKDTDGSGPHWASGPKRVLSLAKPPDSAGSV
jgi:hypothetical protein